MAAGIELGAIGDAIRKLRSPVDVRHHGDLVLGDHFGGEIAGAVSNAATVMGTFLERQA
jgi:hypothetical protein